MIYLEPLWYTKDDSQRLSQTLIIYYQISTSLPSVLLNITGAPNNGTYGSLHHTLNEEFLRNLSPRKTEEEFEISLRYFPEDFDEVLADCKYCKCPYCKVSSLQPGFH